MISPPLARSPKSVTCPGTESWSTTTRPSRALLSRLSTALLSATLPSMSSTILCRFMSAAGSEAIIRPSRSTVTREHKSNTSPSRCETKMTLLPALASSRTPAKTRSISRSPRVAVGSSRIRMRALRLSARAISTSWRSAMERSSTMVSGRTSLRPSRVSRPWTCRRSSARERKLAPTRPSRMFSSTVNAGTRLSSCSTTAMPAACACRAFVSVTGVPSTRISP